MTKKLTRKPIPKNTRLKVYDKYDGHCAYCGKPLEYKDMQVDHFAPFYLYGDNQNFDNMMPSCRQCNFYKNTFTISKFKGELKLLVNRLERDSFIFRLAKQYGMITINQDVIDNLKFFYEKFDEHKE
jgi:hypothetical protein